MNVIETSGLGKRYGGAWALRDCTLAVPAGRLAALVGPNGAGKTTLMHLAVGLAVPTSGTVTVLGDQPAGSPAALEGIAFVAQDAPVYANMSGAEMLHLTRNLNRRFDQRYAQARLAQQGIPPGKKTGKLSGGQRAQLALTLALARRPRLLLLDEPLAMLDPLARRDFMAAVMAAMADDGVSVLLSSHALAELERIADYLVLLSGSGLRVAGEVDDLLAGHRVLTGPAAEADRYSGQLRVVESRGAGPPAGGDRRDGRSGAARLGGAPGRPGRARAGLPARAGRRCTVWSFPRQAHRANGGDAMTTLTVPAGQDTALRPVPWRRMAWVTWRQHRPTLIAVPAVFGAVAVFLWIAGLKIHHDYAVLTACHPFSSNACQTLNSAFNNTDWTLANTVNILLNLAPALFGAFAGAPVLARELETGTYRYAWTQGFGRPRWTIAKLVLLAVAIIAVTGAFSQLFAWFFRPFLAQESLTVLSATVFATHGIVFAAWALAAFAVGAFFGMLIRRIVPAMAATLGVYFGLDVLTWLFLRKWWPGPGGKPANQSVVNRVFALFPHNGAPRVQETPAQVLAQHGITQWWRYIPVSRFWPMQFVEAGWLLVLSLLLTAGTVWLVRRRAA